MTDPPSIPSSASGPPRTGPGALARWGPSALWAIADQALFALSNFLLNVLLARWLPADEYGAFAVAYSVFLLLAMVHSALLIEPLLVFGSGRHEHVFGAYLRRVLRGHVITAGAAALGVLVAAAGALVVVGAGPLPAALLALGVAAPFILFQWLTRRACYVHHQVRESALAGGGYMALIVGGAFVLSSTGFLSVASALALMGAASLVAGMWLLRRLGVGVVGETLERRSTALEHWRYGRWALASGGLSWVNANLLLLLLPGVASLAAAGQLRAGLNLLMPVMHLGGALATVGLPALVRAHRAGRGAATTRVALMGAGAVGVVYAGTLVVFGSFAAELLYAGHFVFDVAFLAWLGAIGLGASLNFVLDTALRSMERSDEVFRVHVFSASFHLAAGLALLVAYQTIGVLVAMAATQAVQIAVSVVRLRAVRTAADAGGR